MALTLSYLHNGTRNLGQGLTSQHWPLDWWMRSGHMMVSRGRCQQQPGSPGLVRACSVTLVLNWSPDPPPAGPSLQQPPVNVPHPIGLPWRPPPGYPWQLTVPNLLPATIDIHISCWCAREDGKMTLSWFIAYLPATHSRLHTDLGVFQAMCNYHGNHPRAPRGRCTWHTNARMDLPTFIWHLKSVIFCCYGNCSMRDSLVADIMLWIGFFGIFFSPFKESQWNRRRTRIEYKGIAMWERIWKCHYKGHTQIGT